MAIPEERLSGETIMAGFINPPQTRPNNSFHWGPVDLNDPSQGLFVQMWFARSDVGDIYLSAPSYTESVLISRSNEVKQVSLAFDQNGQPMVAFVEDTGSAYLYWYDPTIPGFTILSLPAMIDPRITMDDGRSFMNGENDVILAYVRSGSLYYRQQRDRFTIERLLRSNVDRLHHVSMNKQLRLQFMAEGLGGDGPPLLADVVRDLCLRSNVPPQSIDVDELYDDTVQGMLVASSEGYHEQVDWLRDMFMFDKAVYDKTIHFPKRNRGVIARIPYSDLVATSPVALKASLADEQKIPREVSINHIDPDGGFARNKQTASRRSNLVNARKKESIDAQVVLTADQAATVAWTKLKMYWGELVTYNFSTTLKYTRLTPTDVVEVEDAKGVWHRMQLRERNEDGKIIEWEAKQHGGSQVYGSKMYGNSLPPPVSTTPGLVGETRLEILNIPALSYLNDELGLYVAAAGENTAWSGYQLLFSSDLGTTYTEAFTAEAPSVIGDTLTQLEAEPFAYHYPSSQTVEVLVNFQLESVAYDQLLARRNLCVIGDELMQFQTATLIEKIGSKYRYALSGLVRGRFHVEAETWAAGVRFVLIDPTVIFAPVDRSYLGTDLWYKAVSFGHSVDETIPVAYMYDEGVSQREFPVSNVTADRDVSDNVTVTWVGAARMGFDTAPYHSKYFQGYRVKFSNGHFIDTTDQTATYNSAPAGITVQVCGINEITGEGPYSPSILT